MSSRKSCKIFLLDFMNYFEDKGLVERNYCIRNANVKRPRYKRGRVKGFQPEPGISQILGNSHLLLLARLMFSLIISISFSSMLHLMAKR